VIADRVRQAQVVGALEPEWEARFEPRSYGFRPGRGCHDAIEAIYKVARGPNPSRRWVLDADLTAAFDRIDHKLLLSQLGTFPARDQVEHWLKAGVIEKGQFTPTEEGTPQGGVVSPVLLNVALHGMEWAAGVRYQLIGTHAGATVPGSPVLIRYADDLVALCTTKAQAEKVKARLAEWLAPRGLAFNEDKTRIVNLDEGFDFLGFTVRRFGAKLLIRPSKAALRRHHERLRNEMRSLRGANAVIVLQWLTPIVRFRNAHILTEPSAWLLHALMAVIYILLIGALAQALWGVRSVRRAQLIAAAVLGGSLGITGLIGQFVYGAAWGFPLADLVWWIDVAMLAEQVVALILASVLGTPGCEIGVWAELIARRRGTRSSTVDGLGCIVGLHLLDQWEMQGSSRR
jgi:group II intron reverse transcriptase/maturase